MDFNIYSCKYANNSVTLVVENIRTIPLKDLVVYVYYPNGTVSDPFLLNKTISSSAIVSFIDVVNATSDFSKLIIKSLSCPDIAKEASCVR